MVNFLQRIVPLIIILVVVITPPFYLAANPLIVPCTLCDEGGWWYKCSPGTGKGSERCKSYQKGEEVIQNVTQKYGELRHKVDTIDQRLKEPIIRTKRNIEAIAKKFQINMPDINVPDINVPDIDCGLKIPVINKKINPCDAINKPLDATTGVINRGLDAVTGQVNNLFKEISGLFDPIIADLRRQLQDILTDIQRPWLEVQTEINSFKKSVLDVITLVQQNMLNAILYGFAKSLQIIFPFASITTLVVMSGILIALPVIGGYYGILVMIYDIFSLILGLIL